MRMLAGVVVALALVGNVARADGKKLTVDGISLRLWDESSGKVVPFDKPPNPYGLNLTLMIVVKIKGPKDGATPATLTLDASAASESDEATGGHPAWKKQQSRPVWSAGDSGVAQLLFVMPFECAMGVTFVASIGASTKKLTRDLGCAE
jgi:hypothetical protein